MIAKTCESGDAYDEQRDPSIYSQAVIQRSELISFYVYKRNVTEAMKFYKICTTLPNDLEKQFSILREAKK